MGDLVGQSLAHFRIVAKLGEGGMGVVYKATDEKLRRTVALKVLPEALAKDEERRRRLLREARAAAAVTHPNIASVYEIGEAEGRIFIAMEYVEGETLREHVGSGALSVPAALAIALQIARGLAKAHQANVVHRDLKPENVIIGENEHVKLLDFGLAKLREQDEETPSALAEQETVAELTREGKLLGTPGYMSPEQARGQEVDARTDVFAFGVVLYELLTGKRPFEGDTTQDVLIAVVRDTPRRASEVNPLLSADIDRVVERCLEKLRDARYENGQELLDALREVLPEPRISEPSSLRRGPSAPTVSLLTPAASTVGPRGRARWRWGIVALAGLAAAGLLLGYRARGKSAPVADTVPASSVPGDAAVAIGKAITDHPPPKTKSPEAAAAYAAALQDLRDGSIAVAGDDLARATKLDPSFAAAHLELILYDQQEPTSRESFAVASQFRSSLDERGLLLLHAAEVLTLDPPDKDEFVVRLRAVLDRFPDDAEALFHLSGALLAAGHVAEAREVLQRALKVDPQFAGALWLLMAIDQNLDAMDRALETGERCLQISPGAASCLRERALIHEYQGQCAEFEADARRMTVVEPNGPRAFEYLALAIAARNAPVESVNAAFEKWRALTIANDPSSANRSKTLLDLERSGLAGDLGAAAAAARELERLLVDNTTERGHAGPTLALIRLLEEQGDFAKAVEVAEDFEKRVPAWTADCPGCVRLYLLYARHRARRVGDAEFRQAREALLQEALRRGALFAPRATTITAYRYAESPDDVSDALARITKLPSDYVDPERQAILGRMYLIGGKPDEALPLLRLGAAECGIMPDLQDYTVGATPVERIRRHLWLGQALEATGDKAGACEAYGFILDRWKNPKPRSITVEKARERAKALACAR